MEKDLPVVVHQKIINEAPFGDTEFAEVFEILRSTGLDKFAMNHSYISEDFVREFYRTATHDSKRHHIIGLVHGAVIPVRPLIIRVATGLSHSGLKYETALWSSDSSISTKKKLWRKFVTIEGESEEESQACYDECEAYGVIYWSPQFNRSQLQPVPYLLSRILHEILADEESSESVCSYEIMNIVDLMLNKQQIAWAELLFSKLVDCVNGNRKSVLKMGRLITAIVDYTCRTLSKNVVDKSRGEVPLFGWSDMTHYVEDREKTVTTRKMKKDQMEESSKKMKSEEAPTGLEKKLKELANENLNLDERHALRKKVAIEVYNKLAFASGMTYSEVQDFQPSFGKYAKALVAKTGSSKLEQRERGSVPNIIVNE